MSEQNTSNPSDKSEADRTAGHQPGNTRSGIKKTKEPTPPNSGSGITHPIKKKEGKQSTDNKDK
ncbi:hypothetical protein CCAX7_12420 [Capsulimonas corticalis]|uniref:Uncharacterized protein n=1 Tax=Capsulimonas corticalis TaxID=2219043 RepID=A0A402D4D3_9BACT|nr:hypothetical protein [Capsulimonas corticalis]BDI29191.1 hypothetical protein CCAX7_12420 [Capsulimonas corticalis]